MDSELVELRAQEERLQFTRFDLETAWSLGSRLVEVARAEGLPVTVDVRHGDQLAFHAALPGTAADNDAWVERKVRVVRRFGHSSLLVGRELAAAGTTLGERFLLDEREFAAHGGAFPVLVRGVGPVGVVTVSGLPQEEDHRLVVTVLEAFLAGQV
jgi:uncharacterized protein (UPF0303 family)